MSKKCRVSSPILVYNCAERKQLPQTFASKNCISRRSRQTFTHTFVPAAHERVCITSRFHLYITPPVQPNRICVIQGNVRLRIMLLETRHYMLINDPRHLEHNEVEKFLVHQCLVLSSELVIFAAPALGAIRARPEIRELCLKQTKCLLR